MIGRGDQEAERTTIFLLAMQMKWQASGVGLRSGWRSQPSLCLLSLQFSLANQVRRVFGVVRPAKAALFSGSFYLSHGSCSLKSESVTQS